MVDAFYERQTNLSKVIVRARKHLFEISKKKENYSSDIKEIIKDIDQIIFYEDPENPENNSFKS